MHAILCDVFGMHEVRGNNCEPQVMVQGDEEAYGDDVQKYKDLLKKVDKPLHNKTKHSK